MGNTLSIREASKKTSANTRNTGGRPKPKHRRIHYQDGKFVTKGTLLVTQRNLRILPGLNVGFGKNGTLFALEPGRIMFTCEKPNLNMEHSWVIRLYGGRDVPVYKKYVHIITQPQHNRFRLIDSI